MTNSANDLFLFEVQYLRGPKAEALRQLVWPSYETRGWVFACNSYGDAQTWVKALNKVTYRVSFQSILSGDDFHNPVRREGGGEGRRRRFLFVVRCSLFLSHIVN